MSVSRVIEKVMHGLMGGGRNPGPVGSSARHWRLPPTRPTGGARSARARPAGADARLPGRYWARTSDPSLSILVQPFASVRWSSLGATVSGIRPVTERLSARKRTLVLAILATRHQRLRLSRHSDPCFGYELSTRCLRSRRKLLVVGFPDVLVTGFRLRQ